jgi:hypothetical protein
VIYARSCFQSTLLLDSRVLCSDVVRESEFMFQAVEKEGLQEGENDTRRIVHHRQLHDPGIQQEPRGNVGFFEQRVSYDTRLPNTYEDPGCQEIHYPYERFFCFFPAFQGLAQSTIGRMS